VSSVSRISLALSIHCNRTSFTVNYCNAELYVMDVNPIVTYGYGKFYPSVKGFAPLAIY